MKTDRIILGVDPGTVVMGYGLIHVCNDKLSLMNFGILRLSKLENQPDRLKRIFDRMDQLILEYKPDEMAIEAPFFGKNVQSMLKLGRAQGVCIAAALNRSIPFEEYSPRKIKQSLTGSGNASKEQVAHMLMRLLGIKDMPDYLDATDGLAAAVCHHYQKGVGHNNKVKSGSWKAFLTDNPKRVK
ncbi:MAG: crossover junction endodeoxyribonuclease RuvC [Bacteroidetes bacterium]|nr:crossover junction endodeoxyribonuclease RuvC [Bacteroidota bacterium]